MLNLNNPKLLKQQCYLKEGWYSASNGKTITVENPFSGQTLGSVPSLAKEEILSAIEFSQKVQLIWAKKTPQERAILLQRWADLIEENKEDLAHIMTAEQGKPLKEARGEIDYANGFIRWFAEEGKRVYGDVISATQPNLRHIVLKQPIGVCAAITPWNFPSAMITRKVAPALATGCTMIVKPATTTPFSALALAYLAEQAGIPKGVLQIITGNSSTIGEILSTDDRIRKLSFTGSTEVGRILMQQSASTIKKLSMELGGNAPFIIFDDANLEKAVDGLIASKYRNAGQTCISANRIYVQETIQEQFLTLFQQKVQALKVGDGMADDTDIGAMINQEAIDKTQALLTDAVNQGAKIILGGDTNPISKLTFNPTIITNIHEDMQIAHAEIFAPIAPIYTFRTDEEVIQKANHTIYGLAAYFYCNDVARSWKIAESLEYGMVGHNTGMISTEVAPFGGVKQSGFGREGSKYGIEEYVVSKYWCSDVGVS